MSVSNQYQQHISQVSYSEELAQGMKNSPQNSASDGHQWRGM